MKKRNFFTLKVFSIPVLLLSLLLLFSLQEAAQDNPQFSAAFYTTVALKCDSTVVAVGNNDFGQCDVESWTDIIQIAAGREHTVGLKTDGTVEAVGSNGLGQCNVGLWTDIIQVASEVWHTVGLKSDGTVVAVGYNYYHQCDVESWTDITQVDAGGWHTVGLKSDGTVVAIGQNNYGQRNVGLWTDIIQFNAGVWHTVGLKSDGTVVAVGLDDRDQCKVGAWSDIIQVAAGEYHTVGLKSDGTVVAVGWNEDGCLNVTEWFLPPCVIIVDIDIKPGSDPNSINLGSEGNVPIAIFSTPDFDATNIDPLTVMLAGASVKLKGKGTPMTSFEDINQDGLLDIVVHVDTTALELSLGDTEAILEGVTYDGARIRGKDTVRIVNGY